ncbi:MAG: IS630 family transposase [Nitrospirae bacterium]|nr:IS630 family transposase [Nitrospirota bacterium]MBF0555663.1 IS630 family transposase [Nitrospirota bacterium]
MWKPASPLQMTEEQRKTLEDWKRGRLTPQRMVFRAKICLLAADGLSNNSIAKRIGTSRPTVVLWRERFLQKGVLGISEDASHGLSYRRLDAEKVKQIVEATLHTTPKDATHWSTRMMAKAQGVSNATVARIWDAHGLQPHRIDSFKLSNDKRFVEKLTDVVGVYLNPPEKGIVLCVDEKSQIQALDRTQPGLPLKKGRCGTMTHDYKRNGTTCLFAALNVAEGKVIGTCYPRHRNEEFLKFLRKVNRETSKELDLHLILDNYGTHNHPNVKKWLAKHKRFHLHFTPTSSSWLNLVERWFAELTRKRIRRGVFKSVPDLINSIEEFIRLNNEAPKPFVWTKKVEEILEKVSHCKAVTVTVH